jgi:hypothetical protein
MIENHKAIGNLARATMDLEAEGYTVTKENVIRSAYDLLATKKGFPSRKIRVVSNSHIEQWIKNKMEKIKTACQIYQVELWLYKNTTKKPVITIFR